MSSHVPAIVMAGDRGSARPVYGESKVYLEIAGRPLVAHVVATLQCVPEISEVWVVGDATRLSAVLGEEGVQAEFRKPLQIVEQFENLYENAWQMYRRALPGAPPDGRDPESEGDRDFQVLFLSGDLPFATPQEISEFVRESQVTGCEYGIGISAEPSLALFHPTAEHLGIEVTYFNLREARLKQNNLHLAKPARILNRHYIEEMYQHRKQREIGSMISLAWRLLRAREGTISIACFYAVMHFAAVLDRWRLRLLADWVRRFVSTGRVERGLSRLLKASVRLVTVETGGCAVDVDTEEEYDAIRLDRDRLYARVCERAEATYGPLPLPPRSESKVS
ncbi:MAG: NTP transferase domain-containing protein [Myxococcota bacterium]|nr:NTP transferase domain-containing protein [Myxococcota bacterium]